VSGSVGEPSEALGVPRSTMSLTRSSASSSRADAGVKVQQGTLDDLDILRSAASESDGVIHLAFKHVVAFSGDMDGALDANRRAIDTFGEALAGSDRPLVITSGVLGLAPGRLATEQEARDLEAAHRGGAAARMAAEQAVPAFTSDGVRSSAVRISPTCHGEGDNGFMAFLVGIARAKGASGYLGDGTNRWPAVHRLDTAQLFRLAFEKAPAGPALHAVGEEGVPIHEVDEVIGRHLDLPVIAISPEDAAEHFGFLAHFLGVDSPASSALTLAQRGWQPTHPGLIDDLDAGFYLKAEPR